MRTAITPDHLRVGLAQATDLSQLTAAWNDVLAGDRDDGILGPDVARFAQDAGPNLAQMASELSAGTYRPGRLTPVRLPRPDGQIRVLHVPVVRDRIVERAILAVLNPVIDPWLGPFSYAYRPGLGVADAVQAIARLRDEGLGWVAHTDFHDCFSEIPVSRLRRMLQILVDDPALLALIDKLLDRRATAPGTAALVKGLPQGSPLSPLWANLVLAEFDAHVAGAGFPLVRYSDDIVALASSREEAWEGLRVMSEAAGALGMPLGADKSGVMSFEEGFCFLGEDFGPRYPPALTDQRVTEPARKVLYLGCKELMRTWRPGG